MQTPQQSSVPAHSDDMSMPLASSGGNIHMSKAEYDSHQKAASQGNVAMHMNSGSVTSVDSMTAHQHHSVPMDRSGIHKAEPGGAVEGINGGQHASDMPSGMHDTSGMHSGGTMSHHRPSSELAIVEVVSDVQVDDVAATSLVVGDAAMNSVGVTAVGHEVTGTGVVTHVFANGSPSSVRNDIGMTELATKEVLMSGVSMQKANWDTKMELFFVEALAEALRAGKSSPSGFRKREMEEIRMLINCKFETNFTSRQVSDA